LIQGFEESAVVKRRQDTTVTVGGAPQLPRLVQQESEFMKGQDRQRALSKEVDIVGGQPEVATLLKETDCLIVGGVACHDEQRETPAVPDLPCSNFLTMDLEQAAAGERADRIQSLRSVESESAAAPPRNEDNGYFAPRQRRFT
jgi:hypothetical protein